MCVCVHKDGWLVGWPVEWVVEWVTGWLRTLPAAKPGPQVEPPPSAVAVSKSI